MHISKRKQQNDLPFHLPERNTVIYLYFLHILAHSFNHPSNIYVPRTFLGLGDRQLNKIDKAPPLMELKL